MKKKIFIISIISIIIIVLSIIEILFYINNNKISVNEIEVIDTLSKGNSAEAVELIKENIVKIVNKIDDENTIYGTGFFDKSGYLVTNSHVVDIKGKIEVVYQDGTKSKANLISNDITSDLAILSVKDVKAKALSSTSTINLKVTDEVYSVGYQFNLEGDATVTKGILSAKRSASGIEFLQTDAAVNPGNSGGPLINDKGQLLGIITLATDNASMAMAISSDSLELYINKLISNKTINYITEERPENALSSVLNEVGYKHDDIYNEKHIFEKRKNDNKKEESNKEESNSIDSNNTNSSNSNNNNNKPSKKEKDYKITPKQNIKIELFGTISNDPSYYFELGKDLTNCQLNLNNVYNNTVGNHEIFINCSENNNSNIVEVYTNNPVYIDNVTSFDQVSGIWFFKNYRDVCFSFKLDRDVYSYIFQNFDWYNGRPNHTYGGGGTMYNYEDLKSTFIFHIEGDTLTLTTKQGYISSTFKRAQGSEIYDMEEAEGNSCESFK